MDVNNAHIISDLQKIALRQNAVYIPNADASFSKLTGALLIRFVSMDLWSQSHYYMP